MKDTVKNIAKNFWFVPVIIIASILISQFLFRISLTIGSSMEPTLSNGDLVLTQITDSPERYDIIVFKNENKYLIKRVIACPGETIQIMNNTIYINGSPIKDSVLVTMENYGVAEQEITLKEDEYFVLGDNRNNSIDSRIFGPIKKDVILGKSFFQK